MANTPISTKIDAPELAAACIMLAEALQNPSWQNAMLKLAAALETPVNIIAADGPPAPAAPTPPPVNATGPAQPPAGVWQAPVTAAALAQPITSPPQAPAMTAPPLPPQTPPNAPLGAAPPAPVSTTITPQPPAQPPMPPQTSPPAQPLPTIQVTEYTLAELQRACTPLMDQGLMDQISAFVGQFGVAALTDLPKEQYPAFAAGIRQMGAQI
jgi:hypothetical protein